MKSKKRVWSVILTLCLVLALLPVSALADSAILLKGNCGEDAGWTLNVTTGELEIYGTGEICPYKGFWTDFAGVDYSEKIRTVTIGEGITAIGERTFEDCKNLESVALPQTLTSIGAFAFYGLTELKALEAPESLLSIGVNAFRGCTGLNVVSLPGVETIGDYAFHSCESLQQLELPEQMDSLGNGAFMNCLLLDQVSLPGNLTAIPDNLFWDCANLEHVDIPKSVRSIGDHAFQGCYSLEEIGIPTGVTYIGDMAFAYCTALSEVVLPETVSAVGVSAFFGCNSLRTVTIPASVTSLGANAFASCLYLEEIRYEGTTEQWGALTDGISVAGENVPVVTADSEPEPEPEPKPEKNHGSLWNLLLVDVSPTTAKPTTPMDFVDVQKGDWYYDAVAYVYNEGLMNGVSATAFAPEGTLTRAMVVTILYRMEGEPAVRYNGMFTDVRNYQWYTEAVEWAAKNGVVKGYGDGKFGPEDPVTREQLAVILYRYAQSKGCDVTAAADLTAYADGANVRAYAVSAVQWAAANGVLTAAGGLLQSDVPATRAQVAAAVAALTK